MFMGASGRVLASGLLALLLSMSGCVGSSLLGRAASLPKVKRPQDLREVLNALPDGVGVDLTGAGFLNDKLYVSSNVGVLEFDGKELGRIYKWSSEDDFVSGPWYDAANRRLWFYHERLQKLIRYDGRDWELVDLPFPRGGYSRGDMLRGPIGRSNADRFWIQIGYYAWRWNEGERKWVNEPQPKDEIFFSIAPVGRDVLFIMRRDAIPLNGSPEKPNSDVAFISQNGQWREIPNNTGSNFFTKRVISLNDSAVILTEEGKLLRLTPSEITPMEIPGNVEAIVASTGGNLLASFRDKGIYEYDGHWIFKFPSPYHPTQNEYRAYLAESGGRIALATTPKLGVALDGNSYPRAALWVSDAGNLVPAILELSR